MADFFDLLKTRRAVRKFKDEPVDHDLVMEIIRDSCLAPSGGNRQSWRFIVIHDQDLIRRVSDDSKANLIADLDRNPESSARPYETALRNPNFNVFYNAPCLVIICGPLSSRSVVVDCALAAAYFMFSAAARGLGTCWVDLGARIQEPALIEEIGLPPDHRIVAPIIIGHPAFIPGVPSRNEPKVLKVLP